MDKPVVQNMNREHAVKQLKRALKYEDPYETDGYLSASVINSMIYIGDMIRDLASIIDLNKIQLDATVVPDED